MFTAVSWEQLDAVAQGAVLVGVTALAALAVVATAHRRMPATAEALGVVTLLLALADGHAVRVGAFPHSDGPTWWAGVLALVAGGGWALGRATGVRSTRLAAAALGQLPVLLLLVGSDLPATGVQAVLLLQAAGVLALSARRPEALRSARVVAAVVAASTWAGVTMVALAWLPFADRADRVGQAAVVAGAGAVAALVAWLRAHVEAERSLALLVASGLGFVAAGAWLDQVVGGDLTAPAVAALATMVVAAGLRASRRWGAVPAAVGAAVVGAASLPLAGATIDAVAGATRVAGRPWVDGAGADAAAMVPDAGWPSSGPLALQLLVLAALAAAAVPVLGRRSAGVVAVGIAGSAVLVAPLLLPLSAGGACIVALVGATAAVGAAVARPGRLVLGGAAAVAAVLASAGALWAAAGPATSLLAAAWISLLAVALLVTGRRLAHEVVATSSAALAVVGLSVAAGVAASLAGVGGEAAVVVGSATALAVGSVAGVLADPPGRRRDLDGRLSVVAELMAGGLHLAALALVVASGEETALSALLAAGTLAAGLQAARPGRRGLVAVAVVEGIALTWLRLGLAGVTAIEAYTGPVALALLAVGVWADRRADRTGTPAPSWSTMGPGLVLALAPTVLVGLTDPGLVRPLGGLVAGAVVLAIGAVTRRRAAVDVGVAVVVLLGLRQLGPVVGGLPNWATLGATGLALLAVGATFEQRRRDLHEARDRYSSLR